MFPFSKRANKNAYLEDPGAYIVTFVIVYTP